MRRILYPPQSKFKFVADLTLMFQCKWGRTSRGDVTEGCMFLSESLKIVSMYQGRASGVGVIAGSRCPCIVSVPIVNTGGGVGLLGLIFAGYVLLASQNPYPILVYSVSIL